MLKAFGLFALVIVSFVYAAPVQKSKKAFKEFEFDVTLHKDPVEKRYFINAEEIPVYQHQFKKIRALGQEIACKIRGNCQGEKRGNIAIGRPVFTNGKKKSIDEEFDEKSLQGQLGRDDISSMLDERKESFMGDQKDGFVGEQKDASSYGQQPQMDIKMTPQESAAIQAGVGSMSGPQNTGPIGPPQSLGPISGNDALLKMQEQHNDDLIQNSVSSKVDFMDAANKGRMAQDLPPGLTQGMLGGSIPGMPGGGPGGAPDTAVGAMDGLGGGMPGSPVAAMDGPDGAGGAPQAFHKVGEGKDDMGIGSPVSENEIMKAEDIQPSEMQGIDHFLKDSNHVEKPVEQNIDETPPSDNEAVNQLGKTNIDIGGEHASIENAESNDTPAQNPVAGPDPEAFGPMPNPNPGQIAPGGVEVPTLNNLGLGMNPAEMGPMGGPPNLNFVEDNTRQMIQQNSDYKVPQTAFNNLWNNYMSSTQSQLGEKDPSANSRGDISRPAVKSTTSVERKLHRRSNVEEIPKAPTLVKKTTNELHKNNKNFVYVPAFVIRNVLKQVKKSFTGIRKLKNDTTKNLKSNDPPLYITEKKGKRYLVINPESPLIQGFANVDEQFTSFAIPAFGPTSMMSVNGAPAFSIPNQFITPYRTPSFPPSFPQPLFNPIPSPPQFGFDRGLTFGNPVLGRPLSGNGIFRGFVTVPVFSRPPMTGYRDRFLGGPRYNDEEYRNVFNGEPYGDVGYRNSYRTSQGIEYPDRGPLEDSYRSDGPLYEHRPDDPEHISVDYRPTVNAPRENNYFVNDQTGEVDMSNVNTYGPPHNAEEYPFRGPPDTRNYSPEPFSEAEYRTINNPVVGAGVDFPDTENPALAEIRKRSEYGKPYVFTKEHVGFGPITVEAKTASAAGKEDKEEDPKEDE